MTEVELAWVAGILEGEGCFALRHSQTYKGKKYFYPRVNVTMTDLDILKRLETITGLGHIGSSRMAEKSTKPFWAWNISRGADALDFMAWVYPFMGIRRRAKIREIQNAQGWLLWGATKKLQRARPDL